MICKCGFRNEEGDLYCAQCGRKLSRKKSRGKLWIVALLLVVAVGIGAAAGFLAFRDRDNPEPEETEEIQNEEETPEETSSEPSQEPSEEEDLAGFEEPADGWDEELLHYYRDGEPLTGLQELDDEYFYFDESGLKQTGWVEMEGSFHFFTEEGPAAAPGWYSDEVGWFCLSQKGKLITCSNFPDDVNGYKSYFVNEQGYLYQVQYIQLDCVQSTDTVGEKEMDVFLPGEHVFNCSEITLRASTAELQPLSAGNWRLWLLMDGQWQDMAGKFNCVTEMGGGLRVVFVEDVSFDGFCLHHDTLDVKINATIYSVTMKY